MKQNALLWAVITSLLASWLVLPRLARIASAIGLLDFPDKRKVHITPKPRVGGVGMIAGFALASLLFLPLSQLSGYFAGLVLIAAAGLVDDVRDLSHRLKFVIQVVAALLIVYLDGVALHSFGNLLGTGDFLLGVLSVPVTVFCVVGVTNALNMVDGLDGLAGGISLIALGTFALLAHFAGRPDLMLLSAAMAGAVIGFLRYNWHPSRLFMGDTGSMMLGFTLAYLSISLTQAPQRGVPPVAPLLILAIPIADTVTVMVKRAWSGRNPFRPDRYHLHHILLRFGIKKINTVTAILILSFLFSLLAVSGTFLHLPEHVLFSFFALFFITYFITSFYLKKMIRIKVKVSQMKAQRLKRRFARECSTGTVHFLLREGDFIDRDEGKGSIVNTSSDGLCMLTNVPLEEGHTLSIAIGGNGKRTTGRVLWSKRSNGSFKVGITYEIPQSETVFHEGPPFIH